MLLTCMLHTRGAIKAGTTSMYRALTQSVPFFKASAHSSSDGNGKLNWSDKEKFYFSNFHKKGLKWYLSQYPGCPGNFPGASERPQEPFHPRTLSVGGDAAAAQSIGVGVDFTANLLNDPEAPKRIQNLYGSHGARLRFLIMVQDPVKIFHAGIYMKARQEKHAYGQTSKMFRHVSLIELANAKNCEAQQKRTPKNERKPIHVACRLEIWSLSNALYAPMIQYWLTFFKPEQFILIDSASYFKKPEETVSEIAALLNVPADPGAPGVQEAVSSLKWNNRNLVKPSIEKEPPEVVRAVRNSESDCLFHD